MSDVNSPKPAEAPAAPAPAQPGPPPVIRRIKGAEESANDRLLKKYIPAWVISGVVHVALIGGLILLDKMMPQTVAEETSEDLLAVVTDEKEDEEVNVDLTNPDIGFDPELPSAVEVDELDDVNVMREVVPDAPTGVDDALNEQPIDVNPPPGVGTPDAQIAGLDAGELGNVAEGMGAGGTGAFANEGFLGRSGATRNRLVAAGGGNAASEAAVARGLIWLAKQQKSNGSWAFDGDSNETVAATGMALLPFLAAGQTHKPFKGNKYQKNVDAGLKFLIATQKPDGGFSGTTNMYTQGIAAVALCEAYGMTRDRRLLVPAQRAISYIVAAQGPNGSWGYRVRTDGDTSIVGWQIQALHSAKLCKDITIPEQTLVKARRFLDLASDTALKAKYGYRDRNSISPTRSAIGLLCRYYVDGWGPKNQSMAAGVRYLMQSKMPGQGSFDMYYYYYATQVVHFFDGPEWHKEWNPKMRDLLIERQVAGNQNAPVYGSWNPDQGSIGRHCGRLGTTCLALLTLEVYYRHLPLYKRDTAGMRELERLP